MAAVVVPLLDVWGRRPSPVLSVGFADRDLVGGRSDAELQIRGRVDVVPAERATHLVGDLPTHDLAAVNDSLEESTGPGDAAFRDVGPPLEKACHRRVLGLRHPPGRLQGADRDALLEVGSQVESEPQIGVHSRVLVGELLAVGECPEAVRFAFDPEEFVLGVVVGDVDAARAEDSIHEVGGSLLREGGLAGLAFLLGCLGGFARGLLPQSPGLLVDASLPVWGDCGGPT